MLNPAWKALNGIQGRIWPTRLKPFALAQLAFADPWRVIAEDLGHSGDEERFYCFGMVWKGVLTVRFTYRGGVIRIIGAGYWRRGKKIYERENKIFR